MNAASTSAAAAFRLARMPATSASPRHLLGLLQPLLQQRLHLGARGEQRRGRLRRQLRRLAVQPRDELLQRLALHRAGRHARSRGAGRRARSARSQPAPGRSRPPRRRAASSPAPAARRSGAVSPGRGLRRTGSGAGLFAFETATSRNRGSAASVAATISGVARDRARVIGEEALGQLVEGERGAVARELVAAAQQFRHQRDAADPIDDGEGRVLRQAHVRDRRRLAGAPRHLQQRRSRPAPLRASAGRGRRTPPTVAGSPGASSSVSTSAGATDGPIRSSSVAASSAAAWSADSIRTSRSCTREASPAAGAWAARATAPPRIIAATPLARRLRMRGV